MFCAAAVDVVSPDELVVVAALDDGASWRSVVGEADGAVVVVIAAVVVDGFGVGGGGGAVVGATVVGATVVVGTVVGRTVVVGAAVVVVAGCWQAYTTSDEKLNLNTVVSWASRVA